MDLLLVVEVPVHPVSQLKKKTIVHLEIKSHLCTSNIIVKIIQNKRKAYVWGTSQPKHISLVRDRGKLHVSGHRSLGLSSTFLATCCLSFKNRFRLNYIKAI